MDWLKPYTIGTYKLFKQKALTYFTAKNIAKEQTSFTHFTNDWR